MTRASRATAALALAALLLTGCGSGSDGDGDGRAGGSDAASRAAAGEKWVEETSAYDMMKVAKKAFYDGGYHVDLDTGAGSERFRASLTFVDSSSCFGTLRFGGAPSMDITVRDRLAYLRSTAAGWAAFGRLQDPGTSLAQAEAVGEIFAGRWVLIGDEAESFCALRLQLARITTRGKDGLGKVGDVPAARVRVSLDTDESIAFVDAQEPHLILRIKGKDGTYDFSDYDSDVEAPAPPAEDVLDPRKISG